MKVIKKYYYVLPLFLWIIFLTPQQCMGKIVITTQPENQYTRNSGDVEFSINAAGKKLSYQWYVKKGSDSSWKISTGNTNKTIRIRCTYLMNGWYYKCLVTNEQNEREWSKARKIIITDIKKRYSGGCDRSAFRGLFIPRAFDGYCYVCGYSNTYTNNIKEAIRIINKSIGHTFIYTTSPHIADLIIVCYYNNNVDPNMWFRSDEIEQIKENGHLWAGVAFSDDDGIHYMICLNRSFLDYYSTYELRNTIIHEIGHCIGLSHSPDTNDIMYYICRSVKKMSDNDIVRFKAQRKIIKSF